MFQRLAFGFANPNHAAAAICALLPFCWGWRRMRWVGWMLSVAWVVALMATQSRTGLIVAVAEAMIWWCVSHRGAARLEIAQYRCRMLWTVLALAVVALWWLWPRLALDGSILNRPRIWLAGLQLFAANPGGVGLGNSGAVASAFLLRDIPEIRTMVSSHITLLAEFGWFVGWAWLAFIGMAMSGIASSPRIGIAFAGLVLSACSSTVFDWPVLFDFADQGGLGMTNWVLSWMMLAMFAVFGAWLTVKTAAKGLSGLSGMGAIVVLAGVAAACLLMVPAGVAPQVQCGYAVLGESPRDLVLYDRKATLRRMLPESGGSVIIPIHGLARFPRDLDLSGVGRVILHGDCREWDYLVVGRPVVCAED